MIDSSPDQIELDAYFKRTGYSGSREPTLQTLAEIHLAHATHIPFENLDVQLGRPIALDLASIEAKLVKARRGGYCFEQNALFAAVLRRLGFHVTPLGARVRLGASGVPPRTHMTLRVDLGGEPWLADVGFGTGGLLKPVRLAEGSVSRQFSWSFRLLNDGALWILQSLRSGSWQDLYELTLEPQHPIDYEMANHYVSTHPASKFVRTLAVQKQSPDACYLLRNRELTIIEGEESKTTTIDDDESLLTVLAQTFGLVFPPGTRFKCLSQPAE